MQKANLLGAVALVAQTLAATALAQSASDRSAALEGVATRSTPPALRNMQAPMEGAKPEGDSADHTYSDVGVQRLVTKKENAFGWDAGTSFSYIYRSNPLSTNGQLASAIRSGVSELSGFASVSFGNYEFLNGVFTPRLGFNMTSSVLSEKKLDFADYKTQRVYFSGDLKYQDGWSLTPSLEYSNILSSKFGTEDYKEWYPNLSIAKIWTLDEKSLVRAGFTTGYHFSTVDALGDSIPGVTADRLDNWTNSLGISYYRELFFGVTGQAYGELSNRKFYNGQNEGRTDLLKTVGCSLGYSWKFLRLSTFLNFSKRHSSDYLNDYKNLDLGASASAVFNF